jgi:outer membrane lipoprotein carrier protein
MKIYRMLLIAFALAPILLSAQDHAAVKPAAGATVEKPADKGKAAALDLKQVTARLEANVSKINTLQSKFTQEVKSEQFGKTLSSGGGELFYAKPGKMAWHYTAPEEHWYITDGKIFWDYLPATKQAMTLKLDEAFETNLPKSFLFGMGKLSEQFEVAFHPDQVEDNPQVYHLVLTPKRDQDKVMIGILELSVDPKTFLVAQAKLKDPMGNASTMIFSGMRLNQKIDDKIFQFTPPKGVEVIKAPPPEPAGKPPANPKSGGTKTTMQKGAEKK